MVDNTPESRPASELPLRHVGAHLLLFTSTFLAFVLVLSISTAAFADEIVSYRIQDGDTFLALAYRFDVNPDDLAALNGLTDPDVLSIGQQLLIRVISPANPFGLSVPDRRDDVVSAVQAELEPAAASAGIVADPPLQASLLKMIATIGPDAALHRWQPSPSLPSPGQPSILPATSYSQFDGSYWASSNCGPTSLSMALSGIGINADQITLRRLANAQMGSDSPHQGTSWESLATAARTSGAGTKGLAGSNGYRSWSVDELKRELALGHPVLLLVRYRLIPDHAGDSYNGDHYIVGLGFDQHGNLVYNDPAGTVGHGDRRRLTPSELDHAWSSTWAGQVRTAMALYR